MSTSVSPGVRRIWRGVRLPLAFLALVVAAGAVLLLARGDRSEGGLDPASYQPGGGRALARLMSGAGVDVQTVTTVDSAEEAVSRAESGVTLLVTQPDLVPTGKLAELRQRVTHLVLVAPGPEALREVLPDASVAGTTDVAGLGPQCTVAAAVAAGRVTLGGIEYVTHDSDTRTCYPAGDGGATMLHVADRTGTVTVLGNPAPLTNDKVAQEGNAALGMRVLGEHRELVWYLPSADDPLLDQAKKSLVQLIPDGWRYGALMAGVAVVLLALWRARRLGPVIAEPLPVVVRAAETAEGRARLYRRARAAGHAGETLREASRARLRRLLGLPRDAGPPALVAAVSTRTGRHANEIGAVLYGPQAADEPALVRLADELDRVEREVERS